MVIKEKGGKFAERADIIVFSSRRYAAKRLTISHSIAEKNKIDKEVA